MVSPNIQGLGLNDELLEHYRKEVGEMATAQGVIILTGSSGPACQALEPAGR